jgi:thioredoxin 1
MKQGFFLALFAAVICAYGQFGGAAGDDRPPFDSSDIIADRIVKSNIPIMLDFWARWCMPCRMLGPTVEELQKKYAGRIKVIKIDVDVNRRIAAYFRVSSIPAVFFVKDKAVVQYVAGLRDKSAYENIIEELLKAKTPAPSHKDSLPAGPSVPVKPRPQ